MIIQVGDNTYQCGGASFSHGETWTTTGPLFIDVTLHDVTRINDQPTMVRDGYSTVTLRNGVIRIEEGED